MNHYNYLTDMMELPVIPLRGLVVFPEMVLHFDVGRKKSIAALKSAMNGSQKVFLVAQRDAAVDEPNIDDLFSVGTICEVKQFLKIPNSDNVRVVVEGIQRGELIAFSQLKPYITAAVEPLVSESSEETKEEKAYIRAVKREFEKYASIIPKISNDVKINVISLNNGGSLCDYVCYNSFIDYKEKQEILEAVDVSERLAKLFVLLKKENATLEIEAEIQQKVQKAIDQNQREYYLREELKVISESLGDGESPTEEAELYRKKISSLSCTAEIRDKLLKECGKLAKMPGGSHEGTVVRGYLDKCLEIPFGKYTKDSINLERSRKILDKEHFSLEKVKERIIESLAVYKRNPDYSGQIICLAGPPGVGKTSIVRSLAKSMNRKYVRIALGGVHDEAEIRGHRKTYIGAMPGRIIDAVIKSGVMNPVILLDEIDKVGNDYKGDPSSALLEALDPEQNFSFNDHYIDFPVDLSKVLFITTANDVSSVSAPLYDRMEVIELNSYTSQEKFFIAKNYLLKKEMKKHNISRKELKISDDAIYTLIDCYTSEAGVRGLEKNIASICRKASVSLETDGVSVKVTDKNIEAFLGPKKYQQEKISNINLVGTVNGLAWTRVGGTLLPIEVSALDGTGKIVITGNLGDVMQESAKTAVSYVRSVAAELGIDGDFYKNKDIHIHAPEAAVPKDGPSAGLAITTAIVSELTGIPIKRDIAMTGEISLKGKALPIGGLKEKSMAAYKSGCTAVLIPEDNLKDLSEIAQEVKSAIHFIPVSDFRNILEVALEKRPVPLKKQINPIIKNTKDKRTSVTQ